MGDGGKGASIARALVQIISSINSAAIPQSHITGLYYYSSGTAEQSVFQTIA